MANVLGQSKAGERYSGVLWERQKPQTRGTQYVLARKKEAVSFKSCNVSRERLNI